MFDSGTNLRELVGSHSIASRTPLHSLKLDSVPHVWDTMAKPRMSRELTSLLQVRVLRHDKSWNAIRVLGYRAQYFTSQAEVAAKQGSQGARLAMESQRAGKKKSEAMLMYLVAMVTAMVGITYAAVPLYRKFCQATGYGGTVQRREVLEQYSPIDNRNCFPITKMHLIARPVFLCLSSEHFVYEIRLCHAFSLDSSWKVQSEYIMSYCRQWRRKLLATLLTKLLLLLGEVHCACN